MPGCDYCLPALPNAGQKEDCVALYSPSFQSTQAELIRAKLLESVLEEKSDRIAGIQTQNSKSTLRRYIQAANCETYPPPQCAPTTPTTGAVAPAQLEPRPTTCTCAAHTRCSQSLMDSLSGTVHWTRRSVLSSTESLMEVITMSRVPDVGA